MDKAKPFCISKLLVWSAYKKVKANRGSAGIDQQSIEEFDKDWKNNLYRIWNRMSSGTYFPPPVRTVEIPKKDGGVRKLGIPTVSDRIAQMVVKMEIEPVFDPIFHEDSYGYRPNKSAHQAVAKAQERCWKNSWVVDLDIKGFFDNIDHNLLLKAVKHHIKDKMIILYIERWLTAGIVDENGQCEVRSLGTPQGGVISPLLANIFLHYTFDLWMKRTHPQIKFERYADDIICHCQSRVDACKLLDSIRNRMNECRLELHPEKSKIVFCRNFKMGKWLGKGHPHSFDFLGFTFRQRSMKSRSGGIIDGFLPGISNKAKKKIKEEMKSWHVGRASDLSLGDLSEMYNPKIRGWVNYYGKFYPQAMKSIRQMWHTYLMRWARRKYKKFGDHNGVTGKWVYQIETREPQLFTIWEFFKARSKVG